MTDVSEESISIRIIRKRYVTVAQSVGVVLSNGLFSAVLLAIICVPCRTVRRSEPSGHVCMRPPCRSFRIHLSSIRVVSRWPSCLIGAAAVAVALLAISWSAAPAESQQIDIGGLLGSFLDAAAPPPTPNSEGRRTRGTRKSKGRGTRTQRDRMAPPIGGPCVFECPSNHRKEHKAGYKPETSGCDNYGISIVADHGIDECCHIHGTMMRCLVYPLVTQ